MFCNQVKEYLSQKGIKFQERDIAQDSGTLADLKKLGYIRIPLCRDERLRGSSALLFCILHH